MLRIKRDDKVIVIVGKDKGKLGEFQVKKQTELRLVSISARGEAVSVSPGMEFGGADDLFE